MAMLISGGALWMGLALPLTKLYRIPLLVATGLFAPAILLTIDYRSKHQSAGAAPAPLT